MYKGLEYNVQTQTLTETEIPEEQILLQEKQNKINEMRSLMRLLKQQIAESDYKIIKCYEYSLMNMDLPYDISELHQSRQTMRDEINSLEKELKEGEVVE